MKNIESQKKYSAEFGFTLIEILLVLLITSFLLLGLNTAYRQAYLLAEKAEYKRPIIAKARLLTETLRHQLAALYFAKLPDNKKIPFQLASAPDETIQLSFYTLAGACEYEPTFSAPVKIKYTFTKKEDSKQSSLTRTEQYASGEKIIAPGSSETLTFENFEFKLFGIKAGDQLSEQNWKTNLKCKKAPPKAVKILLKWPGNRKFAPVSFQTVIKIPAREALTKDN